MPTAHIITNPWSPVIPADNNCTLYVPKGSAVTYRASQYWNTFKAIEEEEITEELNYQFSFPSYISGGSLTVNGEKTNNIMEFAMNSNVVITAEPKNGYHLAAFTLNGKDVTAEMTDGSYIIEKLDANYVVDAKFAENPMKLSLFMAVGGSVDVEIEKEPHSHVLLHLRTAGKSTPLHSMAVMSPRTLQTTTAIPRRRSSAIRNPCDF